MIGNRYKRNPRVTTPSRLSRALPTPAVLHILLALADGERHGYGIKQEVERRGEGALRLGPGTLYEAIYRLCRQGWIEEVDGSGDERRRLYRLTAEGRRALQAELRRLEAIVAEARARRLLTGHRTSRG
jgi:DNA-binding PadR family transcriptional regulator